MRKLFVAMLVLVAGALVFTLQMGLPSNQGQAASEPRVISVLGVAQVQGENAFVHITVVVPPGQDERAVADAILREYGALPFESAGLESQSFTVTGLVWDTLPVLQSYNPSNEPSGIDGQTALTNTHAMWDGVPTSSFDIDFGGLTDRCPSLVDECPGAQQFDDFNDVTFMDLRGPCNFFFGCTLGVTWFSTSIDEADMALNTKVSWNDGCVYVSGRFDAQTVIGHENGHVTGLGHSNDPNALMYPNYLGTRCDLGQDDIDGISSLYPADGSTPEPTATPTDTPVPTATPTPGGPTATPTPTATASSGTVSVTLPSGTDGYATTGGRNSDRHLLITIALDPPVGDASVSILLFRGGALYGSGTAATGADGTVTFRATNAPSGCYETVVTDVTAAGLTWEGNTPENGFCK